MSSVAARGSHEISRVSQRRGNERGQNLRRTWTGEGSEKKKKKKKNTGVKSATDRNRYPLIAEFVNAFEKLEVSAGDSAERNRK